MAEALKLVEWSVTIVYCHVFELYQLKGRKKVTATDLLTGTKQDISFCAEQPAHVVVPALGGVILKLK